MQQSSNIVPTAFKDVLCPRCKINMDYYIERERLGNGERRITLYYKCPACNLMLVDERIAIKIDKSGAYIEIRKDGSVIGKQPKQKKHRRLRALLRRLSPA
ncbi:MAG: hypothetical protein F7B95_02300 [Desulfurococcales archaeon]|nr:hypothetical protein [Desulfurococcales archaeon]